MSCRRELDWVAKLELLEGYRDRDGLDWDAPKLQLVDLQYSDVRPEQGPVQPARRPRPDGPLLTDERDRAGRSTTRPRTPGPTSAAAACAQYADAVAAASWDSVIFDVPGRESLQRVPTLEPLRGTKAHVGDLLDRCRTAGGAGSPPSLSSSNEAGRG